MKEKFLNLFTLIFLGIFLFFVFDVIAKDVPKPARKLAKVAEFNKKFSGNTFAIDGDSLKVGGKEVRLAGIDAPEYSQTCFNAKNKEYACGQASREFLIKLAGEKEVVCFYAQMDKYNRFLSKCSVGKVSINEEIIKNGMAVIYSFTAPDLKMEAFEAQAKKKKLGIWQGKFQLPKDYRKSHPRVK